MDFYHSIIFRYKTYKIMLLLTLSISDYREWMGKRNTGFSLLQNIKPLYSVEIIKGHDNVRNQ